MLTHSLYPMINPNPNQLKAMKEVGIKTCDDPYKFCYNHLKLILSLID